MEINENALKDFHQDMINVAKESVANAENDEHHVSAATISVSRELAAVLKTEIQAFRKRLLSLSVSNTQQPEQVVQLNIQLFPFTKAQGL